MTLQERLDRTKARFRSNARPEHLAVMDRFAQEQQSSDFKASLLRQGDQAPDFSLPDTSGVPVERSRLHSRGPLVLSFYRGLW